MDKDDEATMHHPRSIIAVIKHTSHAIHTHISPYLTMSRLSLAVVFFLTR